MFIIKFFAWLLRGLSRSTKAVNTVAQKEEVIESIKPAEEVKEIAWFTRKNNIIEEFAYTPEPIYGSNLDKPIGVIMADGTIVYNEDVKPMEENKQKFVDEVTNDSEKKRILELSEQWKKENGQANFSDGLKKD